MRYYFDGIEPEGSEWSNLGHGGLASNAAHDSQRECSPQRLLFESGLALFIPLALAALIEIIFGV